MDKVQKIIHHRQNLLEFVTQPSHCISLNIHRTKNVLNYMPNGCS
jgi:hypothetical protein